MAPIVTALLVFAAILTTVSEIAGVAVAGVAVMIEIFFAVLAGYRRDDEFIG